MTIPTPPHLKSLLCLLALAAIFVRALVPAGFMPDFQQAGTPLVICSGADEKIIYVDETGNPVGKPAHAEAPCSFALNGAGSAVEIPAFGITQFAFTVSFTVADDQAVTLASSASYKAQGPPAVSI